MGAHAARAASLVVVVVLYAPYKQILEDQTAMYDATLFPVAYRR
jgi:hypothetical protein